ncbi:MAG TPA: hypothetical protein VN873_19860 [Candidatus Angelobacter sp.]|nr:hypothetical protein [Candidatus Angelobacter sp.]
MKRDEGKQSPIFSRNSLVTANLDLLLSLRRPRRQPDNSIKFQNSMKNPKPSKRKPHTEFSIPNWMSDSMSTQARTMDPISRIEMAERLEKAAAELRDFKQPHIKSVAVARIQLKPQAKNALLYYAEAGGADAKLTEQEKLDRGARWIIEEALCILETVIVAGHKRIHYRDAEDLEDSNQTEDLIKIAFVNYKQNTIECMNNRRQPAISFRGSARTAG